uniref:Uncharacterized protein n=1 Tax=Lates calcarifer TaxID=8187 RepID=A0A4W6BJ05_LATCA
MDPETTTHTEPMADEEEPLFSNLDIFLFSLIVGLLIYWFMSRKKPEPIPEFKNCALTVLHFKLQASFVHFFS